MRERDARVETPRLREYLDLRDRRPLYVDGNRQAYRIRAADRAHHELVFACADGGHLTIRVAEHATRTTGPERCVLDHRARRVIRGDGERQGLASGEREARRLSDNASDARRWRLCRRHLCW